MICPPLRLDSVREDFNALLRRLNGKEMTAADAIDRDSYVASLTPEQLDAFDEAHWHFNEHQGDFAKAHEYIDHDERLTEAISHHSESQPRTPTGQFDGPPIEARTTGIKHAVVDAERELRGMPIFQKARRAHQQSFDEGIAAVKSGEIEPKRLAAELADESKRARPITTTESMALLYDRMRIQNDLRTAEAEYDRADKAEEDTTEHAKRINELMDDLNQNDKAAYRAGSEQGRGLAIRREMMDEDYSRAKVMATARRKNKGKDLPPEFQQRFEDLTKRHAEILRKLEDVTERSQMEQAATDANEGLKRAQRDADGKTRRVGRTQKAADLKTEFDQLSAAFGKAASKTGANPLFDPELHALIGKMTLNRVRAGINTVEGLVDAIHVAIQDKIDGISKRDVMEAISNYGKPATGRTKDAVIAERDRLKSEMRSRLSREDIASGAKESPELKAYKTRTTKKIAELEEELRTLQGGKIPEKKQRSKKQIALDDEAKVMQRNLATLQRQVHEAYRDVEWSNLTRTQKALRYGSEFVRASVLSGPKTVGKIGSVVAQQAILSPAESAVGSATRQLPGFRKIARKAPRYGSGFVPAAEAAGLRGLVEGVKEIPNVLRGRPTAIEAERAADAQETEGFHQRVPGKIGTVLATPGRVHAAEKNVPGSSEYRKAEELYLRDAERRGESRDDPEIKAWASEKAYESKQERILMGKNPIAESFRRAESGWSDQARSISRMIVPVRRVPLNFLQQAVGEYGLGTLRATIRAFEARNPEIMEKMTPEEADKTMRLLNRGVIGILGMGALALTGTKVLGGYYTGKRDPSDIKPGEVKVGSKVIPRWLLHSSAIEPAQGISTFFRTIAAAKKDKVGSAVFGGPWNIARGLGEETPLMKEMLDFGQMRDADAVQKTAAEAIVSRVEPMLMRDLAALTDREKSREPSGTALEKFGQRFELGVPGLRQRVGTKIPQFSEGLQKELSAVGFQPGPTRKKTGESDTEYHVRRDADRKAIDDGLSEIVQTDEYRGLSHDEKRATLRWAEGYIRKQLAGEETDEEKDEKAEKRGRSKESRERILEQAGMDQ